MLESIYNLVINIYLGFLLVSIRQPNQVLAFVKNMATRNQYLSLIFQGDDITATLDLSTLISRLTQNGPYYQPPNEPADLLVQLLAVRMVLQKINQLKLCPVSDKLPGGS